MEDMRIREWAKIDPAMLTDPPDRGSQEYRDITKGMEDDGAAMYALWQQVDALNIQFLKKKAIISPARKAPLEILCHILSFFDPFQYPYNARGLLSLMNISRSWRDATLLTRFLWTDVHITRGGDRRSLEWWISNAGTLPVTLRIEDVWEGPSEEVQECLKSNAARIGAISTGLLRPNNRIFCGQLLQSATTLLSLDLTAFRNHSVGQVDYPMPEYNAEIPSLRQLKYSSREIYTISAPGLTHLFVTLFPSHNPQVPDAEELMYQLEDRFPNLIRLEVSGVEFEDVEYAYQDYQFPQLQELSCQFMTMLPIYILRSSPAITTLDAPMKMLAYADLLPHHPSLKELKLNAKASTSLPPEIANLEWNTVAETMDKFSKLKRLDIPLTIMSECGSVDMRQEGFSLSILHCLSTLPKGRLSIEKVNCKLHFWQARGDMIPALDNAIAEAQAKVPNASHPDGPVVSFVPRDDYDNHKRSLSWDQFEHFLRVYNPEQLGIEN